MEKRKRNSNFKKREPKDQRIVMRASQSDVDLLNKLSVEEDLPISQIIRKAVKLYSNYYNPPL